MKWTTMVPDVRSTSGQKEDSSRRRSPDGADSDDRQSPGAISGVERISPKLTSRSVQTDIPPDGFSLPGEFPPVYLQVRHCHAVPHRAFPPSGNLSIYIQ